MKTIKISELKLEQEVIINSHPYLFKGVNKVRKKGFGAVQQYLFKGEQGEKVFDLSIRNQDLKVVGNQIIF